MHLAQRTKAATYFAANGIDRALLAAPASVKWLTGFAAPIECGPNPFQGAPPLVWFDRGNWTLVVVEGLAAAAKEFAGQENCRVLSYEGYTIRQPIDPSRHLLAALHSLIASGTHEVAIEACDVPALLLDVVGSRLRPIDGWSDRLRVIKTDEELGKLRENFRLTDIGHDAARPGSTCRSY